MSVFITALFHSQTVEICRRAPNIEDDDDDDDVCVYICHLQENGWK
jgi:hypothetical protein